MAGRKPTKQQLDRARALVREHGLYPPKDPPSRYSLTLMQKAEKCLLSADFSRRADLAGVPAVQGRIFHEVADSLALSAYREGLSRYTGPEAVGLAEDMLRESKEQMPLAMAVYDQVLAMVGKWAEQMTFYPDAELFLAEELFTRDLDGMTFSGRIDLVQVVDSRAFVDDYKTSQRIPNQEEFEGHLQNPFYSWLLEGHFEGITDYVLSEVYVRWGVTKTLALTPQDLSIEGYLRAAGTRLQQAFGETNLRPTAGDHCAQCDFPQGCPLTLTGMNEHASLDLIEEGKEREVIEWVLATEAALKKIKASLKARAEQVGPLETEAGTATFAAQRRETVDKEGLRAWLPEHGGSLEDFLKVSHSTAFSVKGAKK